MDGVDDPGDVVERRETGRVERIGTGLAVRSEASDGVVEIADTAEVVLGARCEHEPTLGPSGGRNPVDGNVERIEHLRHGVPVLDGESAGAGCHEALHVGRDVLGTVGKTVLAVDVHRDVDGVGDRRDVGDQFLDGDRLVAPAERGGESTTRRGERLEPESGEDPRRTDVPRVGKDERA